MSKFNSRVGLSSYSLHCGHIQRIDSNVSGEDLRVDLWHEGACYHVRAFNHTTGERLEWVSETNLSDARLQWAIWVRKVFGGVIKDIRRDRDYSVTVVDEDGSFYWSGRYKGGQVEVSNTLQGVWVKLAEHKRSRT